MTKTLSPIKALVLGMALSLPAATLLIPAQAHAQAAARDASAEAFVAGGAHDVLGVLNDHSRTLAGKKEAFRVLIDRFVDVPRVTRFVLGKYARTATPDQYQRFAAVFRGYAEGVYQRRINDYHGQKVAVTGSVVRKPGDVLVTTMLSGGQGQPMPIVWRVLNAGGGWKVVDVQVSGVWLAITQQQDFVSTIDNAGGKIDVLIAQLSQDGDGKIHGRS